MLLTQEVQIMLPGGGIICMRASSTICNRSLPNLFHRAKIECLSVLVLRVPYRLGLPIFKSDHVMLPGYR